MENSTGKNRIRILKKIGLRKRSPIFLFIQNILTLIILKTLFGRKIKKYHKKSLTQEQLAELVNVDDKHISCIESGKNFPSPDLIERIANALNIEPKDLFEFYYLQDMPDLKSDIISMLEELNQEKLSLAHKYIRTFLLK